MSKVIMIEFPILNEGYTPEDRKEYAQSIATIGARHGVRHVARYDTLQHLTGALQGTMGVNLWEMDSPTDLEAVQSDDEYTASVELRDQLHDMERLTMYLATPVLDEGPPSPDKPALLDLVVLNPGITLDDRAEYGKIVGPIADKYGAKVVQSFRIDRHLRGEVSEAVEFNIWELPDPEVFAKMNSDPDYQANIPERDRLHDMERLTMIVAKPRV